MWFCIRIIWPRTNENGDPTVTQVCGRLFEQPILHTEKLNTQCQTMGGEPQQAVKRVIP